MVNGLANNHNIYETMTESIKIPRAHLWLSTSSKIVSRRRLRQRSTAENGNAAAKTGNTYLPLAVTLKDYGTIGLTYEMT